MRKPIENENKLMLVPICSSTYRGTNNRVMDILFESYDVTDIHELDGGNTLADLLQDLHLSGSDMRTDCVRKDDSKRDSK